MTQPDKLIIVGDSAFAEVAFEYFTYESPYEVLAFAVEQAYLKRDRLFDRPVVAFEGLAERFPPDNHSVYVAITYGQLNQLRTRLMNAAKQAGYALASFISPRAFVWRNVKMGEHCFIFENNTLQPFVTLGNNVVLWTGNQIGHHTHVRDNVFISGHVAVSGFCDIGANTFVGANAAIAHNVNVGNNCWIAPGAVILRNAKDGAIYRAPKSEMAKVSALDAAALLGDARFFKPEG
jgi:sugar O-acyltransferase (sialic acid O-acetyltransferase NeuD family)